MLRMRGRREEAVCSVTPKKVSCLDEVKRIEPYSDRIKREVLTARKQIESIQNNPDFSEEIKVGLIEDYNKDIERIKAFYDGFGNWKCSELSTPWRQKITISSPEALQVYYNKCLKQTMDDRTSIYDKLAESYTSLNNESDVCVLVKKIGKKELEKDKLNARLLRLRVKKLEEYFAQANICLQIYS